MLYIALIVIIVCIILIDLYFKKRKKDISKKLLKKTFTDSFDRNILMVLIFSAGTFFYLADNYESLKEYAVKFSFSTNIENSAPETLREIYDDAISKNSSILIEKLIEENPDNSELHALAAYYFRNTNKDRKEEKYKKLIYHATQAINMGSYYKPWLLGMRGRAKYILKDNNAKMDLKKAISLFEVLLKSNPEDANLLFNLGLNKYRENGVREKDRVDVCAASSPRFLIPMEYFKQALNNSSKNDPYTNMFGWEVENLHNKIYLGLEWNARINIGVYIYEYRSRDYDNFVASEHDRKCGGRYVKLESEMSSNGFCDIFSNAGEEGYEEAYDVIQKWCN